MIAAAFAAPAETCPHPRRRRLNRLIIFPEGGPPLELCLPCKKAMTRMIAEWDRGEITADVVFRRFDRLGYTRQDAETFIALTLEAK